MGIIDEGIVDGGPSRRQMVDDVAPRFCAVCSSALIRHPRVTRARFARQRYCRECSGVCVVKHGRSRDPIYKIWKSMIERCCNKRNPSFNGYGGRGISVHQRWRQSFPAFLADMGERPGSDYSLDRINNDGNYEPGNCRWATRVEQGRNKRNNVTVLAGELEYRSLSEAVDATGVPMSVLCRRVHSGMTGSDLVSPTNGYAKRLNTEAVKVIRHFGGMRRGMGVLLARLYGVSPSVICQVRSLRSWAAAALLLCSVLLPSVASADTGFLPSQYIGKPNPWPDGATLPNEEMLARYIARYGQPPGSGGLRLGFCCELQGANIIALQNACRAGLYGPGHDCEPTITEEVDSSFANPRGGPFMERWWWSTLEGGSAGNPYVTHDTTRACGPYTRPGTSGYLQYVDNRPPCGVPAPRCGDGHADPGETCANCVADLGPCPPPPPPPDNALHLGPAGRFKVEAQWATPAPSGRTGPARPLPIGAQGGAFWFFDAARPELYVNVLDGCQINGRWWVFAAGLTNVSVTITVTDGTTGAAWVHGNPQGAAFAPVQDTGALACP